MTTILLKIPSLILMWKNFKNRPTFTSHVFEVHELLNSAMRDLFTKIQSPEHCLYPLLPPKRRRSNRHRPEGHDYELPNCTYHFHKLSYRYVINCLFRFCIDFCMYPHCTVRIRLLYAFNKYFDFEIYERIILSVFFDSQCISCNGARLISIMCPYGLVT